MEKLYEGTFIYGGLDRIKQGSVVKFLCGREASTFQATANPTFFTCVRDGVEYVGWEVLMPWANDEDDVVHRYHVFNAVRLKQAKPGLEEALAMDKKLQQADKNVFMTWPDVEVRLLDRVRLCQVYKLSLIKLIL
jgi:hypothetical protein